MFNKSYSLGRLPAPWKHALLVPIPKPRNNGYRPITLLSCISKIMEILIINRLNYCARPLSKHSMDFKMGSDTVDAVATLVNYLTSCRDKRSTAIFIDLEKPVEPSDPLIMLTSLINAGTERNIIKWIQDYLTDRKAKLIFQGAESHIASFDNGTPQGIILWTNFTLLFCQEALKCYLIPTTSLFTRLMIMAILVISYKKL